MAQTHRLMGDYTKAIEDYNIDIEESKKINDGFQIMRMRKMIGISYAGLKDFSRARQFFLLALPLSLIHI